MTDSQQIIDLVYNKNIKDKIKTQEYKNGLYIVSTPIGNILDISIRALSILEKSDVIFTEDTRVSMNLLKFYGIQNKKLISFNDISENKGTEKFIQIIKDNNIVSIISDAGTPLVSDPGYKLIRDLISHDICIFSIPGACAAISALTLSGLPSNEFMFKGFLSPKSGKRENQLSKIKDYDGSVIIYESPYKIIKLLESILKILGNVNISVSRELTKKFEETLRGTVSEVIEKLNAKKDIVGEFVVVLNTK